MSGLLRWAERAQEGGLYVLLLLLPFSKASSEILFGVLLIGWLIERLHPATRRASLWWRPSFRPLALAILVYLAICALSIAVSDYPWKSVQGFIGKWLEYVLFGVIVADIGARPGVIRRSLLVVACSSLAVVVEALFQELRGTGLFCGYSLKMYGRMTGPYENPSDLATYLMTVTPVLLAYGLGRARSIRWLFAALMVLLIGCLGRTESVGAWLGFAAALVVLIVSQPSMRRLGLMIFAALVLVSVFWLAFTGHLGGKLSATNIGKVDRWMMWQAALGMIRDRPLLGHGLNTFMANYLHYWVGGEQLPRYAHNCYLQVAAETGLLGLTAFAALLWRWFARLATGLSALDALTRPLLLGLLAGLVAFALQAAFDTNFYSMRQATLFWVLAGLALGLCRQGEGGQPQPGRAAA